MLHPSLKAENRLLSLCNAGYLAQRSRSGVVAVHLVELVDVAGLDRSRDALPDSPATRLRCLHRVDLAPEVRRVDDLNNPLKLSVVAVEMPRHRLGVEGDTSGLVHRAKVLFGGLRIEERESKKPILLSGSQVTPSRAS